LYQSAGQEFTRGEYIQLTQLPVPFDVVDVEVFDTVERPPIPTEYDGGGGRVAEIEVLGIISNTISADAFNIPMPDTTGWSLERIRSVVTYNRSGVMQRFAEVPTIQGQFGWDNANRLFLLPENSRANLWHVFRVHDVNP
jgi:hypothetical protein